MQTAVLKPKIRNRKIKNLISNLKKKDPRYLKYQKEEREAQLKKEVKKLGMNFKIVPKSKWNDYSEIDVILAVRAVGNVHNKSFASNLSPNKKPASKLINAWIAGAPAILSRDDAFLKLKKSENDFLEADNGESINYMEDFCDKITKIDPATSLEEHHIYDKFLEIINKEHTVENVCNRLFLFAVEYGILNIVPGSSFDTFNFNRVLVKPRFDSTNKYFLPNCSLSISLPNFNIFNTSSINVFFVFDIISIALFLFISLIILNENNIIFISL